MCVGSRVAVVVKWGSDKWQWQSNFHIVVGGINTSTSSSFVTRRAFSCRRDSSCCSVLGLGVNVFSGLDASLSLFVLPLRLLPPIHCHQRCRLRCHCGLDVNIIGGFDASSKPFVTPPRLLPPLRRCCHHCHCHHYHRRHHSLFHIIIVIVVLVVLVIVIVVLVIIGVIHLHRHYCCPVIIAVIVVIVIAFG